MQVSLLGQAEGEEMKGHNYGLCKKCSKNHIHPKGMLGKKQHYKNPKERSIKISKALKNKPKSREHKIKISKIRKKLFREGKLKIWCKGKKLGPLSDECKRKKSLAQKKLWKNETYRKRQIVINKKRWENPEYKKHLSKMISLTRKKNWKDPKFRKKMMKIFKKQWGDEKYRKNQRKAQKKLWQDPEYKEKMIKRLAKGLMNGVRPTGLEKQMIKIIQKHNLPYKYVGDGSFLIGWKNPDFIQTNGKKICLETRPRKTCLFWDNCIPEDYEKNRIKHFAKWGWKCIVIWKEELDNNPSNCINKIKEITL